MLFEYLNTWIFRYLYQSVVGWCLGVGAGSTIFVCEASFNWRLWGSAKHILIGVVCYLGYFL